MEQDLELFLYENEISILVYEAILSWLMFLFYIDEFWDFIYEP